MENRKQKRWPFHLPLKKTSVIIVIVFLPSLSIVSAATVDYISVDYTGQLLGNYRHIGL